MSDTIFVRGLALHAYHGVLPYEGEVGQVFKIDLDLAVDLGGASRSDKLADTINYGSIVELVGETFRAKRFKLIEAAAGSLADAILGRFPTVSKVAITVHKPHAPIAAAFEDVGVVITRARHG